MVGKKGSALAKNKRNKKQAKQAHCGGSFSQPSKHTPSHGHFVSLEDELAPLGLVVRTVSNSRIAAKQLRFELQQCKDAKLPPWIKSHNGTVVLQVLADGNCFFRAVADQVCGPENIRAIKCCTLLASTIEHWDDSSTISNKEKGRDAACNIEQGSDWVVMRLGCVWRGFYFTSLIFWVAFNAMLLQLLAWFP